MTIFERIIKKTMSIQDTFSIFSSRTRNTYLRGKYKILNKKIKINSNVKFYQKTVFTGKGSVILLNNVSIGYKLGGFYYQNVSEFQTRYEESQIIINENVAFNNSCFVLSANKITIGSDCRIGANVMMMDFEAHGTNPLERSKIGKIGEITLGNNVWIGNSVIILKNVKIGDNSIVAAGSVVLKGIYPPNTIIGGNPARVIAIISSDT